MNVCCLKRQTSTTLCFICKPRLYSSVIELHHRKLQAPIRSWLGAGAEIVEERLQDLATLIMELIYLSIVFSRQDYSNK